MPTFEKLPGPPPELLRPAERDPHWRRRKRFWTADRLMRLEVLIERGHTNAQIGRWLGTSAEAVNLARKRHGIASQRKAALTARAVATMLGFGCAKKVTWLCERGWLAGKRGHRVGARSRRWLITDDAVLDFLRDPAHWHLWEPERLANRLLREWATELRGGVRFLTATEIAKRYGVERQTVATWFDRGHLPCHDTGSHQVVREDALTGFVPPCQRSKAGCRVHRWTTREDAVLTRFKAAGWTYERIARKLGRTLGSVANRWYRLAGKRQARAAA